MLSPLHKLSQLSPVSGASTAAASRMSISMPVDFPLNQHLYLLIVLWCNLYQAIKEARNWHLEMPMPLNAPVFTASWIVLKRDLCCTRHSRMWPQSMDWEEYVTSCCKLDLGKQELFTRGATQYARKCVNLVALSKSVLDEIAPSTRSTM